MIHIMLGSSFEDAVCKLKRYVLSYEDKATAKYFRGIVCYEGDDGTLTFKTAESFAANGGEALRFNSDPDDLFSVRLSKQAESFGPEDQNAYLKNFFVPFDSQVSGSFIPIVLRNTEGNIRFCQCSCLSTANP